MGKRAPLPMALGPSPLDRLMKLLAIDTAGWDCSVALWEDGQELSFQTRSFERDQAAHLPQLVKEVMGQHTIDQILVNIGPGSFTGIRLGLAFAKGLAIGWDIPLKGMDSFTATYESIDPSEDVLVLIDARRVDVFARRYREGVAQDSESLTRQEVEAVLNAPNPPALSGSGIHPFLDGLSFKEIVSPWRGAQRLAHVFFKNPELVSEPLPYYLREADVTYGPPSLKARNNGE